MFRTLAAQQRLDTVDSARVFASENLAAADAAIGCWNDKYHWNSWRPITAIREAASDGNRATDRDPTWTPLFNPSTPVATPPALVTPPFPEHPSRHNCAAGAIVRTLQYFFGTDKVAFGATSNKSGTTRTFNRLSDALKENINARVWARIHSAPPTSKRQARQEGRALPAHAPPPTDRLTGSGQSARREPRPKATQLAGPTLSPRPDVTTNPDSRR